MGCGDGIGGGEIRKVGGLGIRGLGIGGLGRKELGIGKEGIGDWEGRNWGLGIGIVF